MGYELHITRRDDWSDDEGPEITLAEWLALVDADPELRLDAESMPGPLGRGFALWDAYVGDLPGAWFMHSHGVVSTKAPDEAVLAKMLQIAGRLGAKVQGDDGETYTSAGLDNPVWD